jgi:DNA-directed RNA polymerase subunit beta'
MSRVDYLRGFKENVIMGHIIPAGTGFNYHRKVKLHPLVELQEEPEALTPPPTLIPEEASEEAESEPLVG